MWGTVHPHPNLPPSRGRELADTVSSRSRGHRLDMQGYDPSTYGERIATVYDGLHTWLGDVEPVVSTLAKLCRGGRALELGVGTGRVALPLAARGTEVHGIDASQAMVTQMRSKEGGESIPVTVGDFADVNVEGPSPRSSFASTPSSPSTPRKTRCAASATRQLTSPTTVSSSSRSLCRT